jgi:transposase
MDDVNDGSKIERPRRVEVLTGTERRRNWSDEVKGRIVAESMVPGAVISKIARRHDVLASQIYAWRKAARKGDLVLKDEPVFAAVELTPPASARAKPQRVGTAAMIEIAAGAITVRINSGAETELVEGIIRILKT